LNFFIIAISLKFYLPSCVKLKLHDAIFSEVAITWAKQEELVLKKCFWLSFSLDTVTQRQVIDFFYHHDLAKILFTSSGVRRKFSWGVHSVAYGGH